MFGATIPKLAEKELRDILTMTAAPKKEKDLALPDSNILRVKKLVACQVMKSTVTLEPLTVLDQEVKEVREVKEVKEEKEENLRWTGLWLTNFTSRARN